jgi:hypothetical protein
LSGRVRGVVLALCLVVTAFGCSVDELVGTGALDTSGDGGRRRDGGNEDNDGGDNDLVMGTGFGGLSDAGSEACPDGCRCPPGLACTNSCGAREVCRPL